jgi:hypothetical protein
MNLTINAGRPHTGTSRCCRQVIYSVHTVSMTYQSTREKLMMTMLKRYCYGCNYIIKIIIDFLGLPNHVYKAFVAIH